MELFKKKYSSIVLVFIFSQICLGNDYFERTYQKVNANIEQEAFEANFELIAQLEKNEDFQDLDCYLKGRIYHKIGVSYYLAYREQNAIDYYENKVLKLWNACNKVPESEKANTIYNIGICYQYLGMYDKAKEYLDRALTAFEKDTDYPEFELGWKYHGIGTFYEGINDFFRADLHYSRAINIFQEENKVVELFKTLNSAIILHLDFKEYEKALNYVDQALQVAVENPGEIPDLSLAVVYLNAGTINLELKQIEKARKLADRAIDLLDKTEDAPHFAIGLELKAFCAIEGEQFDVAEKFMMDVLEIRNRFYQEGSGLDLIALTYENLAEMYMRKGDLEKANEHLKKGFEIVVPNVTFDVDQVPIVSKNNALDDQLLIRLIELKTKIYEKQYQRTKNIELLQSSLNIQHKIDSIIKRGLFSFRFQQSKLDFLNIRFGHYGKAIKDALRLYDLTNDKFYLEQAYQFSSKTKALILQQELNRINALRTNVAGDILAKEQSLRKNMNDQQALLFEAADSAKDSLLQEYLRSQNELDAFLREIEQNEPEYFKERHQFLKVPTVESLQRKVPDDLSIIEFFVSEDTIHSFWITQDDFFSISIPKTTALQDAITTFTNQCRSPDNPVKKSISTQIYDQILREGISKTVKSVSRLCIIPDGVLHSVSYEALHNGNDYLIQQYAISYTYAAALIDRQSHSREPSYEYVGFGAKYGDGLNTKLRAQKRFFGERRLSQLSMSEEEIERSAELFEGRTFINNEATLSNFFNYANDAKIVHLSLHGLVDFDDPNRSCIIFDDGQQEFLLSPQDLYQNRLKADLVLLNACHSASGKTYNGEGVQGMSKAFLLGGAHNILSSLWNASEASSMSITHSFLENIKNDLPTDLALQQAKLQYLKTVAPSQQHPYYWANFIVLGEVDAGSTTSVPLYFWIIPLIVTLVVLLFYLLKKRANHL